MFAFLNNAWINSIIGILGLIVGLVGLLLYIKSRIGARPSYQMRSLRLIGKEEQELPAEVKILFQEVEVPRLTLTRIWLWNGGKKTIRGNQIVEDDPIRCVFDENDKILSAHIAATTRTVNKCTIKTNASKSYEAVINFDFLDPNDGMRFELLHTSAKRYPNIKGTIIGIPKGLINYTSQTVKPFDKSLDMLLRKRQVIYVVVLVFGAIALVAGFLPKSILGGNKNPSSANLMPLRIALLTAGLFYFFMPLTALLARRKKYPPSLNADLEKKTKTETTPSS